MIKVLTLIIAIILLSVFIIKYVFISLYKQLRTTEEDVEESVKKVENELTQKEEQKIS